MKLWLCVLSALLLQHMGFPNPLLSNNPELLPDSSHLY